MLAKRLPTILPAMSLEEAIEATKVHSVAGLTRSNRALQIDIEMLIGKSDPGHKSTVSNSVQKPQLTINC